MIIDPRTVKKKNVDKSIIPLINIVFLLLIFFIITGNFNDNLKINVPQTINQKEKSLTKETVLTIKNDLYVSLEDQNIAIRDLEEWLVNRQIKTIVIQSEASLSAKVLVNLMQILEKSRIGNIQLLAKNQL